MVVRLASEQGALQFDLGGLAVAAGQGEQADGLLQLALGGRDLGLVGIAFGCMFEADQVHRRAFELQLQQVAVQRGIEAGDTMLVGSQAVVGMFVVVIMAVLMSLGSDQGQQGEGQGEQQVAHGYLQRRYDLIVTL